METKTNLRNQRNLKVKKTANSEKEDKKASKSKDKVDPKKKGKASKAKDSKAATTKSAKTYGEVFQLKIVLKDTKPPVWRRIQIQQTATFQN